MPLAAAMTCAFRLPTVTTAQAATGELRQTFSYDYSPTYYGRLCDLSRKDQAIQQPSGEWVQVEATLDVPADIQDLEPFTLTDSSGKRTQLQTDVYRTGDWVTWEVMHVKDLGNVGRVKEFMLRRWK